MAVDMLSYIDRPSPIHRLTGATKLICFILWSSAAMLTYDTGVLVFMLVASIVFFQLSNVRFRDISFVVIVLAIFLVINNIAIYVFAPQQGVAIYGAKHKLFHIAGWYNVTLEQLFYQLNITLKYVTVMPAALLFIVTTNPSEFASSLSRIGVSYRISYAVAIALRYIPDIQRDFRTIAISQQARGIDLSKNEKLGKRIKNALSIVMPLIFSVWSGLKRSAMRWNCAGLESIKAHMVYGERLSKSRLCGVNLCWSGTDCVASDYIC